MKIKRRITNPARMMPKPPVFPGCEIKTSVQPWRPAHADKKALPLRVHCTAIFGGRYDVNYGKDMTKGIFSVDENGDIVAKIVREYTHRYWLSWIFDPAKPLLFALMLNPSTATHEKLDPTVKGMLRRALEWGYGGLVVVNVYAYRATKPTDMPKPIRLAIGKWNDAYIRHAMLMSKRGGLLVCGWGGHKEATIRGKLLAAKAALLGVKLKALWINGDGSPKHPLYISFAERPKDWTPLSEELVDAL